VNDSDPRDKMFQAIRNPAAASARQSLLVFELANMHAPVTRRPRSAHRGASSWSPEASRSKPLTVARAYYRVQTRWWWPLREKALYGE